MSLDLSAAVEAVARAAHDGCGCFDDGVPEWAIEDAQSAVDEVAAFIESAVREQIAAELEQVASDRSYDSHEDITEAYLKAASIARGPR